jgi:hypothetical protein
MCVYVYVFVCVHIYKCIYGVRVFAYNLYMCGTRRTDTWLYGTTHTYTRTHCTTVYLVRASTADK